MDAADRAESKVNDSGPTVPGVDESFVTDREAVNYVKRIQANAPVLVHASKLEICPRFVREPSPTQCNTSQPTASNSSIDIGPSWGGLALPGGIALLTGRSDDSNRIGNESSRRVERSEA